MYFRIRLPSQCPLSILSSLPVPSQCPPSALPVLPVPSSPAPAASSSPPGPRTTPRGPRFPHGSLSPSRVPDSLTSPLPSHGRASPRRQPGAGEFPHHRRCPLPAGPGPLGGDAAVDEVSDLPGGDGGRPPSVPARRRRRRRSPAAGRRHLDPSPHPSRPGKRGPARTFRSRTIVPLAPRGRS